MTKRSAFLAALALAKALFAFKGGEQGADGKFRDFHLVYQFVISGLSEAKGKTEVWAPLPSSGPLQEIRNLKVEGPWPLAQRVEPEYLNRYFYSEHEGGGPSSVTFTVSFDVRRLAADARTGRLDSRPGMLGRFKMPDRKVPLDGPIARESDKVLAQAPGMPGIPASRLLYDHVVATLRYDKSGVGWGQGDALWACDGRHGNCTDFHSLYIGLARHASIPARFVIGFPVSGAGTSGLIPGYHCWAEFWQEGLGWVPLDASEAFKHPGKKDYYFGHLDADRVQFSMGRDIKLQPSPKQGPLNYFIYPYVELSGTPYSSVETRFSFN